VFRSNRFDLSGKLKSHYSRDYDAAFLWAVVILGAVLILSAGIVRF